MIRIICQQIDCGRAANVGGPVQTTHKTFDVDLPDVEAWLTEGGPALSYIDRGFVGVEIVQGAATAEYCTRSSGHDGPCNGLPRTFCLTKVAP